MLNHSTIDVDPFHDVYLKEQRDLSSRFDVVVQ